MPPELETCTECGETPCDWDTYGSNLMEGTEEFILSLQAANDGERPENNIIRKGMYRLFVHLKFGHLGKGNRLSIPCCVRDQIRRKWPNDNGEYMGYRSE